MNKAEFQQELLNYTYSLLTQTQYADSERSVQLCYQMGVLLRLLTDFADADSYNYTRIKHTIHPELKPKK